MIWVSIAILVSTLFIGLLSITGLHIGLLRKSILRIFPPARFFLNALMGIEKLQATDRKGVDQSGNEIKGMKIGKVMQGDIGFNELIKVLKENKMARDDVQGILLVEEEAGVQVGSFSPEIVRFLILERGGKQETLRTDPFDPNKPIRELKNWVEENYRKQLAYWMLAVLGIWLVANSCMLYLLNK